MEACQAHYLKVTGSSPVSATRTITNKCINGCVAGQPKTTGFAWDHGFFYVPVLPNEKAADLSWAYIFSDGGTSQ